MTEADSNDDFNLWQREIEDVKKNDFLKVKIKPIKIVIKINAKVSHSNAEIFNKKYNDISVNEKYSINNSVWRKINRGEYKIDDTIDLHGFNEAQAFARFEKLIVDGYGYKRLMVVIVGKGNKSENKEGVLRNMLPKWINLPSIRPFVLYVREASPKHGGSGAYYILLRRK